MCFPVCNVVHVGVRSSTANHFAPDTLTLTQDLTSYWPEPVENGSVWQGDPKICIYVPRYTIIVIYYEKAPVSNKFAVGQDA